MAKRDKVKKDKRYPFVYHDWQTWGRMSVSYGGDPCGTIQLMTLLENKPGGLWNVVNMLPDEAEQFALRILERVKTARKNGS